MIPAHNGPQARLSAPRAYIEAYQGGNLCRLRFIAGDGSSQPQRGGGMRGRVVGFSRGARKRLMDRLAAVNLAAYSRPPAFVTLTYPRAFPDDPGTYKAHARAAIKRLWRQFGKMAVVWRLEFQRRGAPHFHLLIWEPPERKPLKKWLLRAWYDICGTGDRKHLYRGVDVRQVEGWHGLRAYLSKYVAKLDGERFAAASPPGRWWGVEGSALLVVQPVALNLTEWRDGFRVRRAMRRYANIRGPIYSQLQGASVYAPDDLLPLLVRMLRPPPTSHRGGRRRLPGRSRGSPPSPLASALPR